MLEVDPSVVKEAALLLQTSMENAVSLLGLYFLNKLFFWPFLFGCRHKLVKVVEDLTVRSNHMFTVYTYASAVPLNVKLKVGRTWGSLEAFAPDKFTGDTPIADS